MSQVAGRHAFDVSNYYVLFTKEVQRAPIRKSFYGCLRLPILNSKGDDRYTFW